MREVATVIGGTRRLDEQVSDEQFGEIVAELGVVGPVDTPVLTEPWREEPTPAEDQPAREEPQDGEDQPQETPAG